MDSDGRGWSASGFNAGGDRDPNSRRFTMTTPTDAELKRRMDAAYAGVGEEEDVEQQDVAPPQQQQQEPPAVRGTPVPAITQDEQQPDPLEAARERLRLAIAQGGDFDAAVAQYAQRTAAAGGGITPPPIGAPVNAAPAAGAGEGIGQGGPQGPRVSFTPPNPQPAPPATHQNPLAPPRQQQQQQQAPASPEYPPGSLAATAMGFEPRASTAAYINGEVGFQQAAKAGTKQQDEFRDTVLSLQSLENAVFMYVASGGKSPRVAILHSPAKYFHPTVATHLNHSLLGFVGDRSSIMRPTPVKLQTKKAFGWSSVRATTDRVAITAFYADPANANKFYTIPEGAQTTNNTYPNMCVVPLSLLPWLTAATRNLQQVRMEVERRHAAQDEPSPGSPSANWEPVIEWLVAASHDDGTGNGRLTVNHDHVESSEVGFHEWMNTRLLHRLGPVEGDARGHSSAGDTATPQGPPAPWQQQMTATLSATQLAMQALHQSQSSSPSGAQAATKASSSSGGSEYTDVQIAVLLGFHGVTDPRHIQPIWHEFARTSNWSSHRDTFKHTIVKYAETNRIVVDRNLDFSQEWIKRLVKLEFSTGGTGATYATLGKGLDMVALLPYKKQEIADNREREERQRQTQGTMTYDEKTKWDTKGPRLPADTFEKLRRNWATTYVALRILFGPLSPLVRNFKDGYTIFCSERAEDNEDKFTVQLCREITFYACDDMAFFFSDRKHPEFFDGRPPLAWPQSLLHTIFRNIQFQEKFTRTGFPSQWETSAPSFLSGLTEASLQALITSVSTTTSRDQTADLRRQLASIQQRSAAGTPVPGQASGMGTGGSGGSGGGGDSPARQTRPRQSFHLTEIHEALHDMMRAYHAKFDGRVLWKDILEQGNFERDQLPTLPQYMKDGKSSICWVSVLGRCSRPECRFDHPKHSEMDAESFIAKAVALIKPGVDWVHMNRVPYTEDERKRQRTGSRGRGGRR